MGRSETTYGSIGVKVWIYRGEDLQTKKETVKKETVKKEEDKDEEKQKRQKK